MTISTENGHFHGRTEAVFVVTVVMIALCSLFVFFRIISRAFIVRKVASDDYLILLAWALAVGLSISISFACVFGLGRHERDFPSDAWRHGLRKSNYAFSVLYQPALMATKTSILAFYLSFSTADYIFRWACYATLFVVNAGGLALTLVTVFQCVPISAVFEVPRPASATCTDILTIYLSSIPLNIITDLALLFLPMPILTGMRLPKKQKIILVAIFGFGIFSGAVDVVRISYLQSASTTRLAEIQASSSADAARLAEETDSSYYLAFSFMWSAVEVTVGIICASIPALKPLVARFLPAMLRSPDDSPSQFGSLSLPNPEVHKEPPPMQDTIAQVHHKDFGRAAEPEEHESMDMMEFLTGRRQKTSPSPSQESDQRGSMGMMEFLTTPDMAGTPLDRTATALTNTTRDTRPNSTHFFDFVNMKEKKSIVHMTNRESVWPIAVVTVLFFVWGFEYGLLNTLNRQFQVVAGVTTAQEVALRSIYYAGYLVGPIVLGRPVLNKWGFRACYPIGLSIYAAGCLMYWPSAVLTSWPAFLVTNFIVGLGLSNLEVSANPFILLCGPARYAEVRLNLSQGVQAIGTVIAPLIASKTFVHEDVHAPSLVNTQWAYLGIALTTVVLALVYYYYPLPEATNAEMEDAVERLDGVNKAAIGRVPISWLVLCLGVFSNFCYVGGQEVIGTSFASYLDAIAPGSDAVNYTAVAHTTFAVSRFLAAGIGIWVKPRVLLLFFYCGLILFTALGVHFKGDVGVGMMIMVFFFEGPLFSLIFGQALRGQGKKTKFASVLVTAAISGGAVFSPISTTIAKNGNRVPYSLVVAVGAFAGGTIFALVLNSHPLVRKFVDPIADPVASDDSSEEDVTTGQAHHALSFFKIAKGKQRHDEDHRAECRERKDSLTSPKQNYEL